MELMWLLKDAVEWKVHYVALNQVRKDYILFQYTSIVLMSSKVTTNYLEHVIEVMYLLNLILLPCDMKY